MAREGYLCASLMVVVRLGQFIESKKEGKNGDDAESRTIDKLAWHISALRIPHLGGCQLPVNALQP